MSITLEESVREHAPGMAAGYYLELHHNDGKITRYPSKGAFPLKPFSPPSGTPFGSYMIYFVRYLNDTKAMTPVSGYVPSMRIQIPQTKKAISDQAIEEMSKAAQQMDNKAEDEESDDVVEETVVPATPADRRAELEYAIATTPAMITARADFEKQRMAMELAENNQDILNKGHFSRDAAEALALSRAYRREAQVTIEAQAHLSRRTAEEVQSHWMTFRVAQEAQIEGMRMLKEQLEIFARPPPPPPPIDYMPAIVEGLKTLRDFGVALMQTKAGIPLAPPPAASATLPSHTTTAKVTADPSPPDGSVPGEPRAASAGPMQKESADKGRDDLESETPVAPSVAAVAPVHAPAVPEVTGVLDPSQTRDPKDEAARLWRALAQTSEVEAMLALMSPEQLQAFLGRMRERVKR